MGDRQRRLHGSARAEIIDTYAAHFPWIRAVHRPNRGFRKSGGGVVEAFYDGYNALQSDDWEFMVKLDGDLTFAPTYFETVSSILRTSRSWESAAAKSITTLTAS